MESSHAPCSSTALVVRVDARQCEVLLDGEVRAALLRGRLFEERGIDKSPVAVGDLVTISYEKDDIAIDEVQERRNTFARRVAGEDYDLRQILATNVDQVIVVNSVGVPPFSSIVADRILTTCSFADIPAMLVLNKIDKSNPRKLERISESYRDAEVQVLQTSAITGDGMDGLLKVLRDKTSVLYGLSGVGKSTLMNYIDPELKLETREASNSLRSGRHTTTYSQWLPLVIGGAVIDTPGVRKFRPYGIPPHELRLHFAEMREMGAACRFPACMHRDEPDCAVIAAHESGELAKSRYRSYLELLEELESVYGGTGRNEVKDGPDHKARR
ncbi:MAG: ribosome small subunit-dependent GTPase A [Planctomycetota bacterium]|nr:ribosome small subunit-dependent GTPase A [Planctomycetota bacterium]